MKKTKYLYTGFLMLALSLSSCMKLDEYNPSGATAEAVWSTPEGFITLVNAAYSEQRYYYGKEDGLFVSESGTDLWFNQSRANYANQFSRYENLTPASASFATNYWRNFYKAINLCNAGLNRIESAGFTNVQEKNRREGELRFLRAFYYWHIVETWGGVNLKLTETQGVELTATRSPVDEFYKVIVSDLEFAAEHLPNEWGNEYSRATKKSALGFLARAFLSRAYYASGAERTTYFARARDIANEVISRKTEFGIDLWANAADIWNPVNNKTNKEALYVISNSRDNPMFNYDNNANRLHLWFLNNYSVKLGLVPSFEYGFDGQRRLQPTFALLNFYNEEIDARYKAFFQEVWIANTNYTWNATAVAAEKKAASVLGQTMRAGIDTAFYVTKKVVPNKATRPYIVVDRDSTYSPVNNSITTTANTPFVAMRKYHDPNRAAINAQPGFNNVIVMRLAEMYLISAEAEHQLGNNGQAAVQINVLRTRAAVKSPDRTLDMQIAEGAITIDFILDERARELCGEHIRWYDLKRTGKLVERVRRYNPDITAIQDFHTLRPVPISEIDALQNGQEFGNNPGY